MISQVEGPVKSVEGFGSGDARVSANPNIDALLQRNRGALHFVLGGRSKGRAQDAASPRSAHRMQPSHLCLGQTRTPRPTVGSTECWPSALLEINKAAPLPPCKNYKKGSLRVQCVTHVTLHALPGGTSPLQRLRMEALHEN